MPFACLILLISLLVPGMAKQENGECCPEMPEQVHTHVDLPRELLEAYPEERPADAVKFQGSYYKVFTDEEQNLTWHQKKALCERMGGHLAVIETSQEQAFIAKLADDRYLSLGATDEENEGEWIWINGAEWVETHWMGGQPNNWEGDENYLATYMGGEWVDVAAEGKKFWLPTGFICEWDEGHAP